MIKLAKEIGCRNLWLEGDSKNIVNILNDKNDHVSDISNLHRECQNNLNFFNKVYISHKFWETDTLADWMANLAMKSSDMVT